VDKPRGGVAPRPWQDELLGAFAAQAAIAICNARLHADRAQAVDRLEAERRALRASEDRFRQMFDGAPTGMALIGLDDTQRGRFVRANTALCHLLRFEMADLDGRPFADIVDDMDRELTLGVDNECAELRLRRGDGSLVWVSTRSCVVDCPRRGTKVQLVHVWDVDDRIRREEDLARLATEDPLTGLPNRGGLIQRLRPALASNKPVAILFCDLDDFKSINDRYGHRAGDVVLTEVARRLSANVRGDDVVARLGGDEFVVMASGLTEASAHQLATQLVRFVSVPVVLDGERVVRPSASFGIGWAAPGCQIGVDDLLELADRRMYRRKQARQERACR
jgi:diguanylate cyclase (GGDEF)-like protein/PAS domain S-box-containing protein